MLESSAKNDLYFSVEKGFSSYVKSCLIHKSRNFFINSDQEINQTRPLNDLNERVLYKINEDNPQITIFDEEESLFEVIRSLNSLERRLLYLKFYEERPDWQVAKEMGVSRQAITKAKKKLLEKMRKIIDL